MRAVLVGRDKMESTLKERIIDVMEKALNIHFTDNVDFQYSLLDPRIGLKPRDLLVIFFALQESFHITFIENDIVEKRFDFLDNIVASVQEKLDAVS
jgi:acyl carrier protein